ncbi:hypothetical protein [Bordetella phage vB_BbrM_PHB04]|uniref:Uncharacterized protein n=1 Tax=Bordetella phage vB_BbrM_PHB04 TaxID=2029657 RepID=A0A291LA40_9CAUD|nr:hypothetical protein HOS14_gp045 [Bordetella phage vB_BbrM_PHB04]ATI15663.1 hypothetical protein [Bordetella phage vB_BbrM_PHB04]
MIMIAYLLDNPPLVIAIVTGLILAVVCAVANWPRRKQIRNQLSARNRASNDAGSERYTEIVGRS